MDIIGSVVWLIKAQISCDDILVMYATEPICIEHELNQMLSRMKQKWNTYRTSAKHRNVKNQLRCLAQGSGLAKRHCQ
jgi:hypothetical protein